jgi:hypothetical protein
MEQVLAMFKADIGITSTARDTYFTNYILSQKAELEKKGFKLLIEAEGETPASIDDIMLLSDHAAWCYRKRTENIPLSQNLQIRIKNRIVKARSELNG